jgi:hypothetical protein
MPSIGDIANEAKALLEDINTNTLGTRNNTQHIITQLDQLNSTAQAGFTNLAQGLATLIQAQLQNNELLAGNNEQNETIICWLDRIAHVLCDIKHNTDTEVQLQIEMSATLSHIDDVLELVHSREALEVQNRYSLENRLAECCPEDEPEPQPCFTDCEGPRLPEPVPFDLDWKPIQFEQPIE